MSPALMWGLLALGLAVVLVRRRTTAVALVALQSLVLAAAALADALGSGEDLLAGVALTLRAAVLPAILLYLVRRTRETRRVTGEGAVLLRFVLAAAVVLAAAALVPEFGLDTRAAEQASIGLLLVGIVVGATRRPLVFQALAFLVAENGVYIAALSLGGGLPVLIELGVLFDLLVIVSVVWAFGTRIHEEFGTGDTTVLRGLRD